ncbi:MAG: hypothetical protein JWM33_360 [Caulobacteraceae bacterium]|nr:hypothetical protein [Caulobacteraceae bacterium]
MTQVQRPPTAQPAAFGEDEPLFYTAEAIANSPSLAGKTRSETAADPHARSYWTDDDQPARSDPGIRHR